MSLPTTKVRRVNPVKLRRQAEVERFRPNGALVRNDLVDQTPRLQRWVVVVIAALLCFGFWSANQMHQARVDQARAEAKAEVQAEVIVDLRHDRDRRTKKQQQVGSLGDLIVSIFSGILTILNAIVWGLIDLASGNSHRAGAS